MAAIGVLEKAAAAWIPVIKNANRSFPQSSDTAQVDKCRNLH